MSRSYRWDDIEDKALRRMWAADMEVVEIARRLGRKKQSILARANYLGLPRRKKKATVVAPVRRTVGEIRQEHYRRVGDLRRRHFLNLSDPIVLRPSPTMFGYPIREIELETRALIDRAIEARATA